MSDLVKRLRASVRMDAINGDAMERGVCGKQMLEAADRIAEQDSQRERAERAEAECERLRDDLRGLEEVRREQAAGRDYWSAECERNRKDAERYRWAREEIYYKPPGYDGRKVGRWVWDWDFESENGTDLDAAIDAAMQEKHEL